MLHDLMTWRYATKVYDPTKTIPKDKLDAILEAISLRRRLQGHSRLKFLSSPTKTCANRLA